MIVEKLVQQIDDGRNGLNKGLSSGLPKLDSITYGIIRENITLVGASSGTGKSSLVNYIAVYNAYKDYINSEKEYLSSDRFKKDKEFWNEVLTPLPEVATIPIFENRDQKNNTYECLREELIIDNSLLTKIKEFCSKNNVSLFNFLVGSIIPAPT